MNGIFSKTASGEITPMPITSHIMEEKCRPNLSVCVEGVMDRILTRLPIQQANRRSAIASSSMTTCPYVLLENAFACRQHLEGAGVREMCMTRLSRSDDARQRNGNASEPRCLGTRVWCRAVQAVCVAARHQDAADESVERRPHPGLNPGAQTRRCDNTRTQKTRRCEKA